MADKNNYLSRVTYQGGKDSYEFPFSYLRKNFVKAQIDLSERESNTLAYMVDYTIDGHTLKLTKPVDADKTITIYRETSSTPLVEYEDSSILRAYDLNLSQRQNLNILEEQTDIVEESYSLTQDMEASMDKNIMDTKTAIDNINTTKKSVDDSVAKMNTTVADTKKYVDDSVAKMNTTVADTKKYVDGSVAGMNTSVANTKKYVDDSVAKMNTTVADTKKYVEDSLATTTTKLNNTINTATSSMDSKITQTSQALKDAQATLETTKSAMEKELADTQASLKDTENRINATEADITKLTDELKESESSLQDALKNVNSTNRNMTYEVGDQIHSSYLPFNCYITCVTAGTTGDMLPVIPEGDHDSGFTYTDGTATFKMDYWPLSINGKKPLNKAGDITINVDKVKEAEKATYASVLNNSGRQTAIIKGREEDGLRLYEVCLNGYPTAFGNVLSIGGQGDGQILAGWSGVTNGIERLYYRNRRDASDTWSEWKTVAYYDDIKALAPTKTGDGASGTWGINISGNADNADKLDGYHASDIINLAPTKTGDGASGTWNINISGNADNADKLDGYHASDIINLITAKNTGGIVAASLAANGYVKFANGLILQWGTASGNVENNSNTTTFPIAFSSACFAVNISQITNSSGSANQYAARVKSVAKNMFVWGTNSGSCFWIAVGL